jgi:hypothetical protein
MVQLAGDDLSGTDHAPGKAVASVVKVGTEDAWIPDLAFIETQVRSITAG